MTDDTSEGATTTEGSGESLPLDRYGKAATDRARDRKGIIAYMARNGVAATLLMRSAAYSLRQLPTTDDERTGPY